MALNYKTLALNAPKDCKVSMNFEFSSSFPIEEFLEKINIPKLFVGTSYWQGARFDFYMNGIDTLNNFIEREVNVVIQHAIHKIGDVSDLILQAFNSKTRYECMKEEPLVRRMIVSYNPFYS